MESTIIKKETISDVANRLNEVASKRKEGHNSLSISIEFAKEIVSSLNEVIAKAHKQLGDEENEIRNIDKLVKKLQKLRLIDTTNTMYERDALSYAEGESLITNYSERPFNPLESIKIEMGEIAEKINGYVKEGKYEKKQEALKIALEEGKVGPKVQTQTKKEIESVQIKMNDEIVALLDTQKTQKSEEDYVAKLVAAEKMCELCHTFDRYTLILSCQCSVCLKCLKEKLLKESEGMLSNTFEAHKKKHKSMHACPNHGTPIEIKVLEAICGEEEVERASIEAMKRQLQKCTQGKWLYPTICMHCSTLIKDETDKDSAVSLCQKHKLCKSCEK